MFASLLRIVGLSKYSTGLGGHDPAGLCRLRLEGGKGPREAKHIAILKD
jgi:hypothetical protein